MSELAPIGRDLYMRYTDKDGKQSVFHHRVWDRDRFIAAKKLEAEKLRAKDGGQHAAEVITNEQFKAA